MHRVIERCDGGRSADTRFPKAKVVRRAALLFFTNQGNYLARLPFVHHVADS